jgi:hypothetical protein
VRYGNLQTERRKRNLLVVVVAVFAAAFAITATLALIYDSATLGSTSITIQQALEGIIPGSNVACSNYVGARFQADQTWTATVLGTDKRDGQTNGTDKRDAAAV